MPGNKNHTLYRHDAIPKIPKIPRFCQGLEEFVLTSIHTLRSLAGRPSRRIELRTRAYAAPAG
eukprot:6269746-Amphidinium_carterae.2